MMEAEDLQLKYKPMKVCGICGDKALGYNFNAITCEACKAFFRRNALRNKDFKCPFDGNCKIDLVTRRFCQKCRLKKCFDIGMKKEWILSDEEKKVKRDKIIENRRKKDSNHPYTMDNYSSSSEAYSPELKPPPTGDLLTPNYSFSVSEGKGFFNPLFLMEPQYKQYISNKMLKEDLAKDPYSSITKVPNHTHVELLGAKNTSALHSPPPVVATPNCNVLDNFSNFTKDFDSAKPVDLYAHFSANHTMLKARPVHRPVANHANGHQAIPQVNKPDTAHDERSSNYYSKYNFDLKSEGTTKLTLEPCSRTQYDQASSSSDSSHQLNPFYAEKITTRSRSESQIMSSSCTQDEVANDKHDLSHSSGGLPIKKSESNEYLSSDDESSPTSVPFTANCSNDLIVDRNGLSNGQDKGVAAGMLRNKDVNMPRNAITVKPSLSVYNFIEELRIQELTLACDLLRHWCQYNEVVREMLDLTEMYDAVEVIITRVIEMARMITSFKDLCEMEQFALLKGSVTEMLILRSVLNYVPEKDSWVFNLNEDNDKGQYLKYSTYERLVCKNFYVEVKQFMLSFTPEWKHDRTLFDLLTVIILFTPTRSNLNHKEIIKLEYLTYRHLLLKHLESKFLSKELSRSHFTTLMGLLEHLHEINEKVSTMYPYKVIENYKS